MLVNGGNDRSNIDGGGNSGSSMNGSYGGDLII